MALKLIALKLWKPAVVLGASAYASYGYMEWNKAQTALKIGPSMKDSDLLAVFDSLDTDKSGTISRSELKIALDKTGLKFSDKDIDAMVYTADENHDNSISKEEWLNMCKHIHKENHKSIHPISEEMKMNRPKVALSMQDVAEGTGHTHTKK